MKVLGDTESWGTGGPDYFSPPDYITGSPYVAEGSIATPGSEVILNVRGSLGYNAHTGRVINKGPGRLYVYLSSDGSTYSSKITLEVNQTLSLAKEDVNKIKLDTDTAGTEYLVVAH